MSMNVKKDKLTLSIKTIENCLSFLKNQLEIILEKIPKDLTNEQKEVDFIKKNEEFNKVFAEENRREANQLIALKNIIKIETTQYNIEVSVLDDNGFCLHDVGNAFKITKIVKALGRP